MNTIIVKPHGPLARMADRLMVPLMYLLAGTFREVPQITHRWNNIKLSPIEVVSLDFPTMLFYVGLANTHKRFWLKLPIFHMPIFGGWREYVVLKPTEPMVEWYIGWVSHDVAGVSQIPLTGPVRLLRGDGDTCFFGLTPAGKQLELEEIGTGRIGSGGEFKNLPLL